MAMNIHFEARRRQMFLDKAARQRQKAQEMAPCKGDSMTVSSPGDQENTGQTMCTDQGQFYQTREEGEKVRNGDKGKWRPPRKIRRKSPEPLPCPDSLRGVKRDRVFKILHPHTDY